MENTLRTIDLTPTWEGILPALLRLYAAGTPPWTPAQRDAIEELTKMAQLADKYVAQVKALRAAEQYTAQV